MAKKPKPKPKANLCFVCGESASLFTCIPGVFICFDCDKNKMKRARDFKGVQEGMEKLRQAEESDNPTPAA